MLTTRNLGRATQLEVLKKDAARRYANYAKRESSYETKIRSVEDRIIEVCREQG
jgi:hypothetical protein